MRSIKDNSRPHTHTLWHRSVFAAARCCWAISGSREMAKENIRTLGHNRQRHFFSGHIRSSHNTLSFDEANPDVPQPKTAEKICGNFSQRKLFSLFNLSRCVPSRWLRRHCARLVRSGTMKKKWNRMLNIHALHYLIQLPSIKYVEW